jgi:hypothetical protein
MEHSKRDDDETLSPTPTPGSSPRTPSHSYQTGSEEPASTSENDPPAQSGSDSYQAGSQEPATFSEPPRVGSSSRETGDDDRMDPWLPGGNDLDQERGLPADSETRFNRDAWGGRGNPQVSIRLRPFDFRRLRRAAELYGVRPTTLARMMVIRGVNAILDAELRRDGEFLREG